MKKNIKRTMTGEGISTMFGGFPKDLELNKEYTLTWDFENKQYIVAGKYKAISFKWNKPIPN